MVRLGLMHVEVELFEVDVQGELIAFLQLVQVGRENRRDPAVLVVEIRGIGLEADVDALLLELPEPAQVHIRRFRGHDRQRRIGAIAIVKPALDHGHLLAGDVNHRRGLRLLHHGAIARPTGAGEQVEDNTERCGESSRLH